MVRVDKELEFSAIEEAWQRLLPRCSTNTIFTTPQWQKIWWRSFETQRELLLLSIKDNGELIGIAPLMRQGGTISFLADVDTCDYSDFLIVKGRESEAYEAVLHHLEGYDWNMLEFHCLPEYSPSLELLPEAARQKGYSAETTEEDVCPRINLPSTWDDYLAGLRKKERHELRRKMRRLSDRRQVDYYFVRPDNHRSGDVDDFVRLLKISRQDKAAFMSEQMNAFFHEMIPGLTQEGYLKLYFLEVDGVRVAATVCFDYAGEFSLYNSGYDPAYNWLSVGLLLKAFCIQEAINEGKESFDFLRGNEPYKYDLGGRDLPIYSCIISKAKP